MIRISGCERRILQDFNKSRDRSWLTLTFRSRICVQLDISIKDDEYSLITHDDGLSIRINDFILAGTEFRWNTARCGRIRGIQSYLLERHCEWSRATARDDAHDLKLAVAGPFLRIFLDGWSFQRSPLKFLSIM
jgi:hypothetical protein